VGTSWLFEGGRSIALFFARQIQDKPGSNSAQQKALERILLLLSCHKTGSNAARETALERESGAKADSNLVPVSSAMCGLGLWLICMCVCVCVCVCVYAVCGAR